MSDYGVFEASSTDGYEEEQRQRQATRDLGRAIEAAREGFGDFLGAATDKQDYQDRLALVMNDLMQKVADSGVMPVPGVMRKVKAALRPQFRTAGGFSDGVAFEEAQSVVWDLVSSGVELRSWDQVVSKFPDSLRDQAEANKEDIIDILRSKGVWKDASRKQAASWKEVNPRSEGLHPDNAVWKIQGPNGLSGTVIDELKSGTDSDWFIFGPNGPILNRKFGEPPLTVDEAKKLVEDHINSGTLASRKQASDVNTEDQDVLQFFYQFEDEGLDVSASGDEQWEWLKSNIDYDVLQDAIDQADEYGEVSRSNIDSMAYDLQQNFFGSRKQAGGGNWEQSYDGSDEWKLTGNPQVVIMSEDDGFYLFNGIELVEVTDTLEQAMDLGESSHVAGRKVDSRRKRGSRADSVEAIVEFLIFCDEERVSSEDHDSLDLYNGDDEISQDDYNTIYDFIAGDLDDDIYTSVNNRYRQRAGSRRKQARDEYMEELKEWYPVEYDAFMEYLGPSTVYEPGELEFIHKKWVKTQDPFDEGGDSMTASRKQAESYSLGGGWSARVVYDSDDEGEYAEAILTGPGGVEETIYPGDGRSFEPGEVQEEAEQIINEYGDDPYQDTYQYNSRRKQAYTWRFDDMGMGDLDWQSWWTVPEETAEAASGLMGLIAEDGTGQGGFNWSVMDVNDPNQDPLASGNEATVDAAKAAAERAM